MPLETICPGCDRKLQVAVEHVGRQARCPLCQAIYTVSSQSAVDGPATDLWSMRTPEGQTYGPVPKSELDGWLAEGRISADCQLASELNSAWLPATAIYPELSQHTEWATTSQSSASAPQAVAHRGGLILALGIISWAVGCPIFGICAWVIGSSDLREMRAGRMDSSGLGLTQAGQVIGMIHAMICIIGIMIVFAILLAGVSWR